MAEMQQLLDSLESGSDLDRRLAVFELAERGGSAVEILVKTLTDERPRVRGGAALALGKILANGWQDSDSVIINLANALRDEFKFADPTGLKRGV